MKKSIRLKVKRQDGPGERARWDEFDVAWQPHMNVLSALMEVRKNPVTVDGRKVAPPVWDSSCHEEVCGACTMLVNGRVRQACSAMIGDQTGITLEPMTKFPLVRDLVVDRSRMFDDLKKVKAWIKLDGSHELGPGPRQSPSNQEEAYPLSRCMTCGCCLEACPQINDSSTFIGAAAINQVRFFNLHPSGEMHSSERIDALMDEESLTGCGKALNCEAVCPKEIPLVDSIASVQRQATKRLLLGWVLK